MLVLHTSDELRQSSDQPASAIFEVSTCVPGSKESASRYWRLFLPEPAVPPWLTAAADREAAADLTAAAVDPTAAVFTAAAVMLAAVIAVAAATADGAAVMVTGAAGMAAASTAAGGWVMACCSRPCPGTTTLIGGVACPTTTRTMSITNGTTMRPDTKRWRRPQASPIKS